MPISQVAEKTLGKLPGTPYMETFALVAANVLAKYAFPKLNEWT